MRVLAIGGPAGSGKTTVADALSVQLGVPHIDFDVASADVVARARTAAPHLAEDELLLAVKEPRYAALADAIAACAEGGKALVVVSAPFSQHSQDPKRWAQWVQAARAERVDLVWLAVDPQTRWERMRLRGEVRDAPALADPAAVPAAPAPLVHHTHLDASASVADLVTQIAPLAK